MYSLLAGSFSLTEKTSEVMSGICKTSEVMSGICKTLEVMSGICKAA
jgi:hypothetical protein